MRQLFIKRSTILRSMLLILTGLVFLGCTEAHFTIRPTLTIEESAYVVRIPGTYIYASPNLHEEVFFYDGRWYSYRSNYWYSSLYYSGPWVSIRIGNVPMRLHRLPGNYRRHIHSDSHRIHRKELKRHWRRWGRDKHWDHHDKEHFRKNDRKHKKKSKVYYQKKHDTVSYETVERGRPERRHAPDYDELGNVNNDRHSSHSRKNGYKKEEKKKRYTQRPSVRPLTEELRNDSERSSRDSRQKIRKKYKHDDDKKKYSKKDSKKVKKKSKRKDKKRRDKDSEEDKNESDKDKKKKHHNKGLYRSFN